MMSRVEGWAIIVMLVLLTGGQELRAAGPGYVILTTTNIVSASTQLTNFVASKEGRGFDVSVVANTSTNEGGWCGDTPGATGDTASEFLRQWLQLNYTNDSSEQVIDYVLLIGNPHPDSGDVPMKRTYPYKTGSTVYSYPTDYYYADLTADWNSTPDAYYGKWPEDFDTNDYPIATEVYVGRIPFYGNVEDLDSILAKIIAYESSSTTNAAWRGKALLAMDQNGISMNTAALGEWIKEDALTPMGCNWHRVYDQQYALPETTPCIASNVVSVWTNSSFGVVFWFCHGESTDTDGQVIDVVHVPSLDDSHPVLTFQGSCETAWPETTNNLAYSLLRNGSVSAVGCTRAATFTAASPQSQPSLVPGIEFGYASNIVFSCCDVGRALQNYKASVLPENAEAWRNYVGFNVYGCPAVGLYTTSTTSFAGPKWAH